MILITLGLILILNLALTLSLTLSRIVHSSFTSYAQFSINSSKDTNQYRDFNSIKLLLLVIKIKKDTNNDINTSKETNAGNYNHIPHKLYII